MIGAGGAGLAAAIQAADSGASVAILEREPGLGGNTANATGMMRGSETFLQKRLGIQDSWVDDFKEIWGSTAGKGDPILLSRLVRNSRSAFSWLHSHGVQFAEQMVVPPRLGQIIPNGSSVTESLARGLEGRAIEVRYNTAVKKLLFDSGGSVEGCEAETDARGKEVFSGFDAVILATGGAWGPRELLEPLLPDYTNLIVTWGTPTGGKGDGWRLAGQAGGETFDLSKVMLAPAAFLDENLEFVGLAAPGLRRAGAIILDQDLRRIVNEDESEYLLGMKMAELLRSADRGWAWEIWDGQVLQKAPKAKANLDEIADMGLLTGDTLDELASKMRVKIERLRPSIDDYNQNFVKKRERDEAFGRPLANVGPINTKPFFAMRLGLSLSHSRGGIRIDSQARVLNNQGKAISSLFAAGDDTGGFFGEGYTNGINILRAVVYGRIAGENAALGTLGAAERQGAEP